MTHSWRILEVASIGGLRFGLRNEFTTPLYDGRTVNLYAADTDSDLLHELGHFLVAKSIEPSRATIQNYGLGEAYAGNYTSLLIDADDANIEERLASVLGICFEAALKLNYETTLRDHRWNKWEYTCAQRSMLRYMELLDADDRPTLLHRLRC